VIRSLLACLLLPVAFAQTPDPSLKDVADTPGLPRVLLIGDSISMGYTIPVREILTGKANVHRILENGGPTTNGVKNLDAWLGSGHWDAIHFNFGLHDLKLMDDGTNQVSLADYEKNLRVIVERLKKTGAALVWATTTPVPEGKLSPPRKPEDVLAYNAIAAIVMQDNGIAVDDLFLPAGAHQGEWQRPANVHFTDQGYRGLAEAVAQSILDALGKK
jgi:acyl-CoA thioesterase-1